jgi:hypothetical protein
MAKVETTTVLGHEGVDTKELRKLTKDFHDWKPDKALHKALRVAGELIADDARAIASTHSQKIPPTIKVRVSKTRISVVAGGQGVPTGGLFELGNKGRGKSQVAARGGKFRHPVFGNRSVWVNQDMHPYLLPAAKMNERKIEHLEGEAVAEAFRESGFKVSG